MTIEELLGREDVHAISYRSDAKDRYVAWIKLNNQEDAAYGYGSTLWYAERDAITRLIEGE